MDRRLCGALSVVVTLAWAPASAQAPKQVLVVGQDVKPGDHVKTAAGQQQPMLSPDGASLTVGPSSDVALDTFQYDPAAKRGELALSVLAGSLKVGGGAIAKSDAVTVAAGASQVKIHGATAVIGVRPAGAEIRMLAGDRVAVTAEGVTQTMAQPDSVIMVPAHKPPSPPTARATGGARSTDWAKSFQDLDALSRTINRAVEGAAQQQQRTLVQPMGR
jgi:hypothetical protein